MTAGVLIAALLLVAASRAGAQAPAAPPPVSPTATPAPSAPPDAPPDAPPPDRKYRPSEEVSADAEVDFPADL
ncbi:MAG: hypothetical protein CMK02_05335 [Polycyclovorans sp.]|nr:hypothetical protein [Polycyclovorans sp.]